jgi:truncated hemoglobin YjbI
MPLLDAVGGAAGCRAIALAFYARVERDPVLRPLFPSTFTCAIEEFSAFLVQFFGGDAAATQGRWWLSLSESHSRFAIGPRERTAWLRAMTETLGDGSTIRDSGVRTELIEFFRHASAWLVNAHVVNKGAGRPPLKGEVALLWEEQVALDEALASIRSPDEGVRCAGLLQGTVLRRRFARSPAVHASLVSRAALSGKPEMREYAFREIRTNPSLVLERYSHWRTLLHDASGAGDVAFVELVIDTGGGQIADDGTARSPLYCVANECGAPGGSEVVRQLLKCGRFPVNATHGLKRCTALHMAARRGNTEIITALLDGGAEIEARDNVGDTPLRRAVNCNKVEAARVLLARGADRYSSGSKGLMALQASRSSQMEQLFSVVLR